MLFDAVNTKTIVVVIIAALYTCALLQRRISNYVKFFGALFFAIGAPLGFDTVLYKSAFKGGKIVEYGPLWEAGYNLANLIDCWWVMYPIVYVILLYSFVKLSETTNWPSLVFAALVTMPGIGFNCLSLLRQAFGVALIIYIYLDLKGGVIKRVPWISVLAYFAHPTTVMIVPIIIIFQAELVNVSRKVFLISIALTFGVILLLNQDLINTEAVRFNNLMDNYINSDTRLYEDSGVKLFLMWCLILLIPSITFLFVNKEGGEVVNGWIIMAYLAGYGFLLSISSQAVRLAWYGLPILFVLSINKIGKAKNRQHYKVIGLMMAVLCFVSSVYVVLIAREHFWSGVIDGIAIEMSLE